MEGTNVGEEQEYSARSRELKKAVARMITATVGTRTKDGMSDDDAVQVAMEAMFEAESVEDARVMVSHMLDYIDRLVMLVAVMLPNVPEDRVVATVLQVSMMKWTQDTWETDDD